MAKLRLDPEQRQAVDHNEGPLLVVAGAGTGKTQVITHRIAALITKKLAEPKQILALTFTEKAAGEMLDRLDPLIGWEAYQVNVMTFHAFGSQLLQRFGHHLGWSGRNAIIPEMTQIMLLRQHLSAAKLAYFGPQRDLAEFARSQLQYIQTLQNADVDLPQYRRYVRSLSKSTQHPLDIAEAQDRLVVLELYESLKDQYGFIDYHDQIARPLRLLSQRPNLLERLRQQYRYVLVDEYQDTNAAQDQLLRHLIPPGGNIFAVGDDDQAIYGFRGARLGNILEFCQHFKVKQPLVLTHNYRSSQPILDAAYRLIQHNNPERLEAKLGLNKHLQSGWTGLEPVFQGYSDAKSEYEAVAATLAETIQAGTDPESLAVLATTHAPLRALSRVLRLRGVPYRLSSLVNVFEQPEIRQLWHLLRWIGLTAEDEAIIHLLSGPLIGWPSQLVRQVADHARRNLSTIEETLQSLGDTAAVISPWLKQLETWRQLAQNLPISQLIYQMVFESDLSRRWIEQAQKSSRMVRVLEDLQLWLRHTQEYESVALDPTLAGYLQFFPLPPELEAEMGLGDEHGVALLTVHAAKGLEFEDVCIINCTREAWNEVALGRRQELPEGLTGSDLNLPPQHERRRLLYVAMTRAKRRLTLSAPIQSGSGALRRISPYLAEVFPRVDLAAEYQIDSETKLAKTLQQLQQFSPTNLIWSESRLPFEANDGWLELALTDLQAYVDCPWEFYLTRVLGIRLPLGPPVAFGSLMHGLIHDYYEGRQNSERLSLNHLSKSLEERWQRRGYRSAAESEADQVVARQTLAAFYTREERLNRRVVASEETVNLSLSEPKLKLKGRIDALIESATGLEIRDFKTGRSVRKVEVAERRAKDSLQLRSYALALNEQGRPVERVVLDYIVTGVEGSAVLSARILQNHRTKLGELAELIRQRQFAPNPSPYHDCVMARYWGSGMEEEGG